MKILRSHMVKLLSVMLALALASCGHSDSSIETSPYSAEEIAQVIMATQSDLPMLTLITTADADFAFYLKNNYFIDPQNVEEGVICYPMGAHATEAAVLRLSQETDPSEIENALKKHVNKRELAFTGYAPNEAALAEHGTVTVHGQYIAMLICEDNAVAQEAFLACFREDPPPLPQQPLIEMASKAPPSVDEDSEDSAGRTSSPSVSVSTQEPLPERNPTISEESNTSVVSEPSTLISAQDPELSPEEVAIEYDLYDHDALLAAWHSGDASPLTPKNREILTVCQGVISSIITDNMTDYEKELAIHDWMIGWIDYDWEANSQDPHAQPDPDSDNPYASLLHQKAICYGYSSTFQLFMDLLGIECITVTGTASGDHAAHSWNMVCIDGDWYCVDVTWDDPKSNVWTNMPVARHRYFNVTSDLMRNTSHYWEETAVPEATATAYRWKKDR